MAILNVKKQNAILVVSIDLARSPTRKDLLGVPVLLPVVCHLMKILNESFFPTKYTLRGFWPHPVNRYSTKYTAIRKNINIRMLSKFQQQRKIAALFKGLVKAII